MKKSLMLVLLLCLIASVVMVSGCKNDKEPAVEYGKLAIYSIDCTDLGYELKVENGTWAQTYDAVISLVKAETDSAKRMALMHKAEDLLMTTGCIMPIYYYTDLFMIDDAVEGFYSSPLGYKYFQNSTVNGSNEQIDVCLASEPGTIDPALNSAVDGATIILHCFSGLIKWERNDKGQLELVADCCTEIPTPTIGEDGKATYVFTIKDGLKYSDGSALNAKDFEYAWKRAIKPETAADYEYMFDVIDGYSEGALNVTASEDGKTLTVVLSNQVPYFIELCAFPTYMPVKQSVVEADPSKWATSPATYIGNGPYVLTEWTQNSTMTYEKNPYYHDADSVTMKKIVMHLSDDATAMLSNFKTGAWQFIDDVPTAEIAALKTDYPTEFKVEGQLGTYYYCMNINKELLPSGTEMTDEEKAAANAEVRQALGLLLDRNYIIEHIAQGGQVPASSFVAMGLTDADGSQFYMNAGDSNAYTGYFDTAESAYTANCAKAVEILKKYFNYNATSGKFTNVPTIEFITNPSAGHVAIAEYAAATFANYGITMKITTQDWNVFLETRKSGNYVLARNGWLADYNDPISFLDMWISTSGNNDCQLGK